MPALRLVLRLWPLPLDNLAPRYPISIKGVVTSGGRVVLLQNERGEWELPGGKLEATETPESCLEREIEEELGVVSRAVELLDVWLYHIRRNVQVLIVTYGCEEIAEATRLSAEHSAVGLFGLKEVETLKMPDGYKASIRTWLGRHRELAEAVR